MLGGIQSDISLGELGFFGRIAPRLARSAITSIISAVQASLSKQNWAVSSKTLSPVLFTVKGEDPKVYLKEVRAHPQFEEVGTVGMALPRESVWGLADRGLERESKKVL